MSYGSSALAMRGAWEIKSSPAVHANIHFVSDPVTYVANPAQTFFQSLGREVMVGRFERVDLHSCNTAVEQEPHDFHRVPAHLHVVDRPVIGGGVVNAHAGPRLSPKQTVQRQPRSLAQNIELRHVDGTQHAHISAARGSHRSLDVHGAPDAVDIARIAADDQTGVLLERPDLRLRKRIGLAHAVNAFVGV